MTNQNLDVSDAPADDEPATATSDRSARGRSRAIRLGVLVAVLVGVTGIGIWHQLAGTFRPVGVDALCPFGGVETLWALLSGGAYVERIAASSVIILVAILITAVLFRRSFCGYICPLGALQELFGRLGRRLFNPRLEVPKVVDRPARYLKYAVLVGFSVWTWVAAQLVMRPYDPWAAYMHVTSAELWTEFGVGAAILLVSLAGSLVYDRFFCKYLCPTGALLAIVGKLSVFRVHRAAETCIDCKACDKACPVNIEVSTAEHVTDAECISCNECVNACPISKTLDVSTKAPASGERSVLKPDLVLGSVAGIIVAVLAATTVTGAFAWEKQRLGEGANVGDELEAGKAAAAAVPFDCDGIRGSDTFVEVSDATGISLTRLQEVFGFSAGEKDQKIKDLAGKYGYDVHTDVREWVGSELLSTGRSVVVAGQTYAPEGGPARTPAAGAAGSTEGTGAGESCSEGESST